MIALPRSRPLTRADLDRMPDDDGHRYELIDGALVVTPAPAWRHQRGVLRLARQLEDACHAGLQVFVAPLDVSLADDTVLQPDVLVARTADLGIRDLPAAPVLAVEVLSPSTRHIDLDLKRACYQRAGCPSYWVLDPDGPSLVAWDLVDRAYVEIARVGPDESWSAAQPFPVEIRPADLLADPIA